VGDEGPALTDVPPIRCGRFELVSFTAAFMDALAARDLPAAATMLGVTLPNEDWLPEIAQLLRLRRDQLARDPSVQPWLARAIVLPDRRMAGYIGFHDRPDASGMAEMGYTVFEAYRRQGIAHDAIRCLTAWATREHGVRRSRVSIAPDNAPSLALAAKLGFVRIGEQIDEIDGVEWVFEAEA
jgi:RimJ/RimL family protein N-acetyltransferase